MNILLSTLWKWHFLAFSLLCHFLMWSLQYLKRLLLIIGLSWDGKNTVAVGGKSCPVSVDRADEKCNLREAQATGLDAWASRVKCPARFVSHLHEICIYIWVVYSLCFFCCLFITVIWWYVWCFEWASGNQEEVQACFVTLWLFIISCYSLYKTTLGLLCSWFENNPHLYYN